ncbi:uncharacterized protein LOC119240470 isoform X2 [Talpa occidentalis]|uniref:uncharacterized protein LOC119240470 isoform X2 n=1 Tax=Talpa occidentalis TaxID=50954 RepID=UPI0023FA3130|nr:uncharacterized protein LOC119240470 isoform X2 [Talpa occidentalis]
MSVRPRERHSAMKRRAALTLATTWCSGREADTQATAGLPGACAAARGDERQAPPGEAELRTDPRQICARHKLFYTITRDQDALTPLVGPSCRGNTLLQPQEHQQEDHRGAGHTSERPRQLQADLSSRRQSTHKLRGPQLLRPSLRKGQGLTAACNIQQGRCRSPGTLQDAGRHSGKKREPGLFKGPLGVRTEDRVNEVRGRRAKRGPLQDFLCPTVLRGRKSPPFDHALRDASTRESHPGAVLGQHSSSQHLGRHHAHRPAAMPLKPSRPPHSQGTNTEENQVWACAPASRPAGLSGSCCHVPAQEGARPRHTWMLLTFKPEWWSRPDSAQLPARTLPQREARILGDIPPGEPLSSNPLDRKRKDLGHTPGNWQSPSYRGLSTSLISGVGSSETFSRVSVSVSLTHTPRHQVCPLLPVTLSTGPG